MARIDDLIKYVALRVDEYLETEEEASSSEIPFGDISFELDEASTYLLRTIPRHLCYFVVKGPDDDPTVTTDSVKEQALIALPDDYLRFYSVTMDGWARKATAYLRDDSEAYDNQQYRHLRGTPEKPVAFLVANPDSPAGADLEVYPAGEGTLEKLLYVPDLDASDMPTDFDDALVWKAASAILQIMGYTGLSQNAFSQMQVAISRIKTGLAGEESQPQPKEG